MAEAEAVLIFLSALAVQVLVRHEQAGFQWTVDHLQRKYERPGWLRSEEVAAEGEQACL